LSDGSAAQYKKRKKIINIYHEQDFGFSSEWRYLQQAMRIDKQMGIGGTVKRLAAKPNLQRV
jgi:hypothetical protein